MQQLSYGATAEAGLFGGVRPSHLLELPADMGSLRDNGNIGVSELVVSAGLGRSVKGIQMGVVGKLVEQRFGPHKASTGAVDLGVTTSQGPVTLGLAVQNLGPAMTVQSEEIPLPLRFALGASTRSTEVGPLDLSASSAVSYRMDGDVIPSLGLEVGYWPVTGRTFVARVGFRHLPRRTVGVARYLWRCLHGRQHHPGLRLRGVRLRETRPTGSASAGVSRGSGPQPRRRHLRKAGFILENPTSSRTTVPALLSSKSEPDLR